MKKIYTIGRDEGCDIVIPDNTDVISRLHATIRIESNDKIYLIDQSRNGTYINGMKMSSNVEIPVSRKDVVSFAHIYNLDWSLVPKQRGNILKGILIVAFSLIIMTGFSYIIIGYFNKSENIKTTTEIVENPGTPPPPIQGDSVESETVVAIDTAIVVTKQAPKTKDIKKDSIEVEKPEEEIYNPIY